MDVKLFKRDDGRWQADIRLPDGRWCHAIGHDFGDALIELDIRAPSDTETLIKVCSDPEA